jgi:hypothetical protein
MEGFKKSTKVACFKEGGQVAYKSRKPVPKVPKEDKGPDYSKAAPVKDTAPDPEAPAMKKGGRAKKKTGTVKKYADGGFVDAIKEQATDLKNKIIGTPEQNRVAQGNLDKQASQGSTLAKVLGGKADSTSAPVTKKRGGKC